MMGYCQTVRHRILIPVFPGSIPCAAIYLSKMACEYDKNIMEYLYQTKDTESHEDSDFCYDWGRKNV